MSEPLPPSLASRYRPERELGRGGFGRVLLCRDLELDRRVALKLLTLDASDPEVRARFDREARVTAALSHPGVVQVFDYGVSEEGEPFIVYAFVEGAGLLDRVAEGSPEPATARAWAEGLAESLQAVHEAGLIHRDVKPENVLLAEDGRPVLCDLGIVRALSPRPETLHTAEGLILGTPAYMAPELWKGYPASQASDQFAWAATLVRVLTGRGVYASEEPGEILQGIRDWTAVVPDTEPPTPTLRRVLLRALEADPDRRHEDMGAVLRALRSPLERAAPTVRVERSLPTEPAAAPVPATRSRRLPAAALLLWALVGGGLVFLSSSREPAREAPSPPPAEVARVDAYEDACRDLQTRFLALREIVGPGDEGPGWVWMRSQRDPRTALDTIMKPGFGRRVREVMQAADRWLEAGNGRGFAERKPFYQAVVQVGQMVDELERAASISRTSFRGGVSVFLKSAENRVEAFETWKGIRQGLENHLARQAEALALGEDPLRLTLAVRLAFDLQVEDLTDWTERLLEAGAERGALTLPNGADLVLAADILREGRTIEEVSCEDRVRLIPRLHAWWERVLPRVPPAFRFTVWKSLMRLEIDPPRDCRERPVDRRRLGSLTLQLEDDRVLTAVPSKPEVRERLEELIRDLEARRLPDAEAVRGRLLRTLRGLE